MMQLDAETPLQCYCSDFTILENDVTQFAWLLCLDQWGKTEVICTHLPDRLY